MTLISSNTWRAHNRQVYQAKVNITIQITPYKIVNNEMLVTKK